MSQPHLNPYSPINFTCDRCESQFEQDKAYSPAPSLNQLNHFPTYCVDCVEITNDCSFSPICEYPIFNRKKQLCRQHNHQVRKRFNEFLKDKSISTSTAWEMTWEQSGDWRYFWNLIAEKSQERTNSQSSAETSAWKKLKKRKLEAPPTLAETVSNLQLPEVIGEKVDKRTLRKTGRTEQFATRVSKEWLAKIKEVAKKEDLKLVEVLEKLLEVYEKNSIS